MLVSKDAYLLNLFLVFLLFFLFVFIISIFGYIFLYFLKKFNNKNWDLNFFETFLLSYAIGLSIYISYCFILDILRNFNVFTAYYSIVIIDTIFIYYLGYRGDFKKEDIKYFFKNQLNNLRQKFKNVLFLFLILITVIIWQIWIQWEIITSNYALSSKDPYVWLGQSWYLLEKGYLLRGHLPIHYPKGYTFYLAAPELIYPDYRLAYFYLKFGGIPFFTFYIIVLFILLKRIFDKNYLILFGLFLVLLSNLLFSRFISFVSSSIPTLLILISLIILRSKAPFYLIGFFITSIFLFNAIFGLFYIIAICFLLLIKLFSSERNFKSFIVNYIGKTLIITIILLLSYILHTIIVSNVSILDIIIAYLVEFGYPETSLFSPIYITNSNLFLLQFRYVLKNTFPNNAFISEFLDIEKKILSYFFIFAIMSLFFSTKKYFSHKFCDLINFLKLSILIIIGFYLFDILFGGSSNVFTENVSWFKWRALEAFGGPLVILVCFFVEKVINKTKLLTTYLLNYNSTYKKLINNKIITKIIRLENILMILLLVSSISTIYSDKRIYTTYFFDKDHIDAVFYIKENVPENSRILVSDYDDTTNCFYDTLSTYKCYLWDYEYEAHSFNETRDYILKKDIDYLMIEKNSLNSTELNSFKDCPYYDKLYENDAYVILEIDF